MDASGAQNYSGDPLPSIVGPYLSIYFREIHHWEGHHVAAFAFIVFLGNEFLSRSASFIGSSFPKTPVNPKLHYDRLSPTDVCYIVINKASVVCFTYHLFRVLTMTPSVKWQTHEATFANSVLVLVPMYIVFDFFYSAFHRFLHLKAVYPYIHKHHHKQISPTRGHCDAFNVHPVEFLIGEYLHLLAFYLIPCHIFAVLLFVSSGAILATLNHTRYDVHIPGVYDSKDHAVHHRLFEYNFGQYTMMWDKIFGWHRAFDEKLAKSG